MKGNIFINKKRIFNFILVFIMLFGILSNSMISIVYANTANQMSMSMIQFFQTGAEGFDVNTIKEAELRVYGVFLSNFFTPGQTQLNQLSINDTTDELSGKISQIFFDGTSSSLGKVKELNNLVYKAIYETVPKNRLTDSSGNILTGKDFIRLMANKEVVFREGNIRVIDFSQDSFRGAFKILASQSAEFIVGRDYGIPAMTELYIDPFGNIWGAYDVEVERGDTVDVIKTRREDLHLVLPAALNPLSFFTESGLNKTRLPLNNSFAMGSMISDSGISSKLSEELDAYYNLPYYFSESDKGNALSIYALNSPFNYIGNTNFIVNNIKDNDSDRTLLNNAIKNFVGDKKLEYANNLKIIMGNRLDVMSKTLQESANKLIKTSDNYLSNKELYSLYEYLYGTHITSIDKTISTIYYFDTDGNETWADTKFDKLGLIGINMFGKEEIDEVTKKGTGRWFIHGHNSQVLSKALSMYVYNHLSLEETKFDVIKEQAGFTGSIVNVKDIAKEELEVYKNFIPAAFSGETYIHALVSDKDSWIRGALLYHDTNSGNWGHYAGYYGFDSSTLLTFDSLSPYSDNPVRKDTMAHSLLTYGVVGAKLNANKTRENTITIKKSSSEIGNLKVMNDRVYEANWPGIFWGYMVEMLQMEKYITYDEENNVMRYDSGNFVSAYLPNLPSGLVSGGSGGINLSSISGTSGVANSENKSEEDIKKDLLKRLYGLTSDSPNNYRDSWLKNVLDGFILSTHRAITGSWLADVATVSSGSGSTYSSIVGYVNTPSLYDLPFTSWIINNYMQIYVLALLFIIVVTIFMVLMNMRTWKQGIVVVFLMAFALLIPNIIVENTINISNKVTDNIYSERFDFWALTQHQQSVNRLKGAEVSTSDIDRILANTGEKIQNIYSQDAGVRVKWMAPKKDGTFDQLFNSKYLGDNLATNLTIFRWLFSSFIFEQEFVSNDPLATYMYRPYNSIARDAKEYYDYAKESMKESAGTLIPSDLSGEYLDDTSNTEIPLIISNLIKKTQNTTNEKKYTDMFIGSAYWIDKTAFTRVNDFEIHWSDVQREDIEERGSQYPNYIQNIENRTVSLWGLGSDVVTETILEGGSFSAHEKSAGIPAILSSPLKNNTDPHLVAFYKNTESPYYYFYSTLKARYGDGVSFKSSLLEANVFEARDIQPLSTNKNTNRLVRDFLDLEGLFTNIIPYMSVANNYVYEWTRINGTDVPDYDFSLEDDLGVLDESRLGVNSGDTDLYNNVSNQYMTAKKQREDMEKVWFMYTPWVDQLNSLSKLTETIKIGSDRVKIENTLNPSSYLLAGRPMIFSEVDMVLKGYTIKDLTETEIRIQRVLSSTYRDLMYLINYYDLDDEVLLNAAAMYATFNFNREFSETSFIGESVMLYPQNFEMKNFNYDAFMRMIMLNATGEPIFGSQDLYVTILSKTSWFTGIMLLVVDVLAVIVIPTMKIIILLMLLFLSILLCITVAVSPPEKIVSVIFKSLVVPAALFMIVNIIFAWLVSLLVGEGLTQYVGSRSVSIATNDPTVTIGILIIMSVAYIVTMWKLITLLFTSLKTYGLGGLIAGISIVGAALTTGVKSTTGKALGVLGSTGGGIIGGITGGVMSEKGDRLNGALSGARAGASGRSVYLERSRERRMKALTGSSNRQSEYMKNKIEQKSSQHGSQDTSVNVENRTNPQGSSQAHDSTTTPKTSKWSDDTTLATKVVGAGIIAKHKAHEKIVLGKERLKSGITEAKVSASVFKYKLDENLDKGKKAISGISDKGNNLINQAKSSFNDIKNNPTEYSKSVKRKGKQYVGSKLVDVKTGVGNYVETSKKQIKDLDEKASKAKLDKLNDTFNNTYGYSYEEKQLSKLKGDVNYKGEVTRDEIRRAYRKVNKQDNRRANKIHQEIIARANKDKMDS